MKLFRLWRVQVWDYRVWSWAWPPPSPVFRTSWGKRKYFIEKSQHDYWGRWKINAYFKSVSLLQWIKGEWNT